ncbi:MAG: hypothetical protein JEZ00_09250 [Anaerolineaceae bacterium]|nr:hypothetical protein [Anaerolineaceae bacterium]
MGKKLFITGAIILILFGSIFLSTVFGSFLISRVSPVRVAQSQALMPIAYDAIPKSENMNSDAEEITNQLDTLQEEVIGIRHLMPDETIYRNMLSQPELRERITDVWLADYTDEDIRRDTLVYALLGVIEPDFDLKGFIVDLYSEQIAGFYDGETKEMVVIQGGLFGGLERMTYAHEFTHLLQDQNYNFDEGLNLNDELYLDDMDAYVAIQALVEGDAVMTEYLWYQMYATADDQMDVQQFAQQMYTPVYDTAPWFIKNELLYPYQFGLEFIHTIYVEQGWDGVEAVYANPPASTEQIMHPERYLVDPPVTVSLSTLADTLPDDWEKIAGSSFGEGQLYLTLMNMQGGDTADTVTIWEATKGWGGDQYQLYVQADTDEVIFVLKTQWDTEDDAVEFMETFSVSAKQRWANVSDGDQITALDPNFGNVQMHRDVDSTYWIFAPNDASLNMILNGLLLIRD